MNDLDLRGRALPENTEDAHEPSREGSEPLIVDGEQFELLGVQRGGASVYRGKSHYLRIGPKSSIERDLQQHREMEIAKYPVPQIISDGELPAGRYFIEASVGARSFRAIFQEEYESTGSVSDASFVQFLAMMKKLFVAQTKAREPEWKVPDFAAGIGVTRLSAELGAYRSVLEERFVQVVERLKKIPGALQHGDCNPANIYEGGIIDLEDSFKGPLGYDSISALMTIEWSPETRDHEFYAQYRFSPEQKASYLKAFSTLCKKNDIPDITRHVDDFAFCRAIWLCVGMREWPRIQQWRFEKLIETYLS